MGHKKVLNFARQSIFEVGRGSKSDLKRKERANNMLICDSNMSKQHARISRRDGLFYLKDCSSLHGTYYNSERLNGTEVLLVDRSIISFINLNKDTASKPKFKISYMVETHGDLMVLSKMSVNSQLLSKETENKDEIEDAGSEEWLYDDGESLVEEHDGAEIDELSDEEGYYHWDMDPYDVEDEVFSVDDATQEPEDAEESYYVYSEDEEPEEQHLSEPEDLTSIWSEQAANSASSLSELDSVYEKAMEQVSTALRDVNRIKHEVAPLVSNIRATHDETINKRVPVVINTPPANSNEKSAESSSPKRRREIEEEAVECEELESPVPKKAKLDSNSYKSLKKNALIALISSATTFGLLSAFGAYLEASGTTV